MKLLWVLPYTPTMIRTRPYNWLRVLIERGHDLTLAAVWETPAELVVLEHLAARGVRVFSEHLTKPQAFLNMAVAFLKGKPLQSRYSWSPRLAQRIADLLCAESFDAVHVEHLRGAAYGMLAQQILNKKGQADRVLWDSVDCISLLFMQAAHTSRNWIKRWVTRFELTRTRQFESQSVRTFNKILVTSANDKAEMEHLAGQNLPQVIVLPNGVDTQFFSADGSPKVPAEIVFSGKMSYHANETAALNLVQSIMPIVWARLPEARVVLAGQNPGHTLKHLAKQDQRVLITGTVGDIRPFIRRATVAAALVPYGVGIQNKVLEALACETAVVGSSQAAAALQVADGREILIAEGVDAQAQALLQVLMDDDLQKKLAAAGRAYVVSQHDWKMLTERLEQIYQAGHDNSPPS